MVAQIRRVSDGIQSSRQVREIIKGQNEQTFAFIGYGEGVRCRKE